MLLIFIQLLWKFPDVQRSRIVVTESTIISYSLPVQHIAHLQNFFLWELLYIVLSASTSISQEIIPPRGFQIQICSCPHKSYICGAYHPYCFNCPCTYNNINNIRMWKYLKSVHLNLKHCCFCTAGMSGWHYLWHSVTSPAMLSWHWLSMMRWVLPKSNLLEGPLFPYLASMVCLDRYAFRLMNNIWGVV